MQINHESSNNEYILKKYSCEGFIINDKLYKNSVFISQKNLISPWLTDNIKNLKKEHLLTIIKLQPKILIIGSGKQHFYLSNDLLFLLYSNRIGCEIMPTDAACRTYNLLSVENRNVCSILFPFFP